MKIFHNIITLSIIVMSFSCQQSLTGQAPKDSQWRGEKRDGVYNETGLLKAWPADGPELLWFYEGLGAGFTSAAIANERLYITGLSGNELLLFVFNLKGELLYKKEVGKEESERYPGPRSTVVVNDGKLYIYNALGKLICLDENTFSEIWSKEILTDFGGVDTDWGVTESPLIVGEKIFITPGGTEHNIVAFNKNTGALIWSSPGSGTRSAYCSPQYIEGYSVPMLVTSNAEYIIAVNADTGEPLWTFPQQHEYDVHPNTPLYHDGMIMSTAGYRVGTVMIRLKDNGKAVEEVWKNPMDNQIGGAIKIDNFIYATGHQNNRFLHCIDWNTGETKYLSNDIREANIIYADGMLYCYSNTGDMFLVQPGLTNFEIKGRFRITKGTEQHWAHPVIHNGVMYLRHGDALMAYRVK